MKTTVFAAAIALCTVACGAPATLDRFTGTWEFVSGTETTVCEGFRETSPIQGNISVSEGVTSDLVIETRTTDCVSRFFASGDTASVDTSDRCRIRDGETQVEFEPVTGTFSVEGDTAEYDHTTEAEVTMQGRTIYCTVTGSGKLQRVGR